MSLLLFACIDDTVSLPASAGEDEAAVSQPAQQTATSARTVRITPSETRGVWEGWGASLAWWANGIGDSAYAATYEDLFFTRDTVSFAGRALPGLGLNIVRYNVGGGGRPGDVAGTTENVPRELTPWFRDIDGYLIDWNDQENPDSRSWDWSRDAAQRSVLQAALARGVTEVELFANAPMWWMTQEKSSAGGRLQSWNHADFGRYLATVAARARSGWGVTGKLSVEPFNEPSAGWWNYPKNQEGCNLGITPQAEILAALREQLDRRGLEDVAIAASDENGMTQAARTLSALANQRVALRGTSQSAASLVDRVNVHAYSGIAAWRDNGARQALRRAVGTRRLWMSEYGDPDASGLTLAQTIIEDLTYLRPTAWLYWQPLEPHSWGLVTGAFADSRTQRSRGQPTAVNNKYFVLAQFSRFVRPGAMLLGNDDPHTVAALDAAAQRLDLVSVNYGSAQVIRYDLSAFARHGSVAQVTYTQTAGPSAFARLDLPVVDHRVELSAKPNAVYALTIDGVAR